MLTLPKDVQRKLALDLSPPDLISFCSTNKELNIEICGSKDFWRQKLQIDYPQVFNYYSKTGAILVNPKNTYIRKFTEVSVAIENFVKEHIHEKYRNVMYELIYNFYQKIILGDKRNHDIIYKEMFNKKFSTPKERKMNISKNGYDFQLNLDKLINSLESKRRMYNL